jgi:hypothetical protein
VFHYLYPNNIEEYLHALVRGRILKVVSSEQLVTKSFDGERVIERLEVGRIRLHNE